MPANQFLPWATAGGANALTPAAYASRNELAAGVQVGIADPALANTTWRQSSSIAAMVAQFMADNQSGDVLDNGVIATLEAQFIAALGNVIAVTTRTILKTNTTITINSTTGNDATGSTTSPFKSLQAAGNYAYVTLDLAGYTLTFSSSSSAFTTGVVFYGTLLGQKSAVQVVFALGASSITSVGSCFFAASGAAFTITSTGPLQSSGTGYGQGNGIFSGPGATVNYSGVNFSTCVSGHVGASNGGVASILGPYTISGNAPTHFNAQPYGFINNPSGAVTVTLVGTPAFSVAFAYCYSGYLIVPSMTFSGSATGAQYFIDGYGTILNNTGTLASYFPGSTAGTNGVLSTLGFTASQAVSGYIKIPSSQGAIIVQWGIYSGGGQDVSVAFPVAFPTNCRSVTASPNVNAAPSTLYAISIATYNQTNFQGLQRYTSGGTTASTPSNYCWLAIGY